MATFAFAPPRTQRRDDSSSQPDAQDDTTPSPVDPGAGYAAQTQALRPNGPPQVQLHSADAGVAGVTAALLTELCDADPLVADAAFARLEALADAGDDSAIRVVEELADGTPNFDDSWAGAGPEATWRASKDLLSDRFHVRASVVILRTEGSGALENNYLGFAKLLNRDSREEEAHAALDDAAAAGLAYDIGDEREQLESKERYQRTRAEKYFGKIAGKLAEHDPQAAVAAMEAWIEGSEDGKLFHRMGRERLLGLLGDKDAAADAAEALWRQRAAMDDGIAFFARLAAGECDVELPKRQAGALAEAAHAHLVEAWSQDDLDVRDGLLGCVQSGSAAVKALAGEILAARPQVLGREAVDALVAAGIEVQIQRRAELADSQDDYLAVLPRLGDIEAELAVSILEALAGLAAELDAATLGLVAARAGDATLGEPARAVLQAAFDAGEGGQAALLGVLGGADAAAKEAVATLFEDQGELSRDLMIGVANLAAAEGELVAPLLEAFVTGQEGLIAVQLAWIRASEPALRTALLGVLGTQPEAMAEGGQDNLREATWEHLGSFDGSRHTAEELADRIVLLGQMAARPQTEARAQDALDALLALELDPDVFEAALARAVQAFDDSRGPAGRGVQTALAPWVLAALERKRSWTRDDDRRSDQARSGMVNRASRGDVEGLQSVLAPLADPRAPLEARLRAAGAVRSMAPVSFKGNYTPARAAALAAIGTALTDLDVAHPEWLQAAWPVMEALEVARQEIPAESEAQQRLKFRIDHAADYIHASIDSWKNGAGGLTEVLQQLGTRGLLIESDEDFSVLQLVSNEDVYRAESVIQTLYLLGDLDALAFIEAAYAGDPPNLGYKTSHYVARFLDADDAKALKLDLGDTFGWTCLATRLREDIDEGLVQAVYPRLKAAASLLEQASGPAYEAALDALLTYVRASDTDNAAMIRAFLNESLEQVAAQEAAEAEQEGDAFVGGTMRRDAPRTKVSLELPLSVGGIADALDTLASRPGEFGNLNLSLDLSGAVKIFRGGLSYDVDFGYGMGETWGTTLKASAAFMSEGGLGAGKMAGLDLGIGEALEVGVRFGGHDDAARFIYQGLRTALRGALVAIRAGASAGATLLLPPHLKLGKAALDFINGQPIENTLSDGLIDDVVEMAFAGRGDEAWLELGMAFVGGAVSRKAEVELDPKLKGIDFAAVIGDLWTVGTRLYDVDEGWQAALLLSAKRSISASVGYGQGSANIAESTKVGGLPQLGFEGSASGELSGVFNDPNPDNDGLGIDAQITGKISVPATPSSILPSPVNLVDGLDEVADKLLASFGVPWNTQDEAGWGAAIGIIIEQIQKVAKGGGNLGLQLAFNLEMDPDFEDFPRRLMPRLRYVRLNALTGDTKEIALELEGKAVGAKLGLAAETEQADVLWEYVASGSLSYLRNLYNGDADEDGERWARYRERHKDEIAGAMWETVWNKGQGPSGHQGSGDAYQPLFEQMQARVEALHSEGKGPAALQHELEQSRWLAALEDCFPDASANPAFRDQG